MNAQATHPPSLFNGGSPAALTPTSGSTPREARTLLDLMYDGFYLLFLLRAKQGPGRHLPHAHQGVPHRTRARRDPAA